jgi:hypothetical protein
MGPSKAFLAYGSFRATPQTHKKGRKFIRCPLPVRTKSHTDKGPRVFWPLAFFSAFFGKT